MNKIITHLDLDLASSNEYKIINAQQLDNNTRRLEVNLFHEGKIYDISNVTKIELQGSRGDGLAIKTTLSHNGNTIIVDFDDTILGAKGLCKLKIALYNSGELLSSFPFIIRVDENVYDENGIIASPVYSELDETLKKVEDIETKESSRVEAENKRVSSEQARNNAESTRIKAEESRVSSENERRNSETSRVSEFTNMKNELSEIVENNKNINIEAISPDDEHYQVKVTDKNGVSKTSTNLLNKLSIGTVETGEYDEVPTANIIGKFGEQKLNLRLPIGKPFKIKKTYSSITDMNQNIQADLDLYEFCMINTGNVEDEDTAKLYMRDVNGAQYITDLSGAQGIQGVKGETGATPNLTIGTVSTGEPGTDVVVTVTGTDENPIFNFTIPKGEKGDNGENATTTAIATTSANGLMSKDMVTKLNGIATGANKTVIDTIFSSTSTNPVQNKVVKAELDSIENKLNEMNTNIGDKLGKMKTYSAKYVSESDYTTYDMNSILSEGSYMFTWSDLYMSHSIVPYPNSPWSNEGGFLLIVKILDGIAPSSNAYEFIQFAIQGTTIFSRKKMFSDTYGWSKWTHFGSLDNGSTTDRAFSWDSTNKAANVGSFAAGINVEALRHQVAAGHYNNTSLATNNSISGTSDGSALVIGNGSKGSVSNAFRVTGKGITYAKGSYNATGADYAEFSEWADGNPNDEDRRGYFVTYDEEKPTMIRKANEGDYILGIVSGNPCIIGNADEDWIGRYVFDEFGTIQYEEIEEEEEYVDKDTGETKTRIVTITKYKENPNYDPTREYEQRENRKEWSAIGWLGVLPVHDDGSCVPGGYCKPINGGIVTTSERRIGTYRVLERVTDNIVKVVLK